MSGLTDYRTIHGIEFDAEGVGNANVGGKHFILELGIGAECRYCIIDDVDIPGLISYEEFSGASEDEAVGNALARAREVTGLSK